MSQKIIDLVNELGDAEHYYPFLRAEHQNEPMPSVDRLRELMELLKSVLFPSYFGDTFVEKSTLKYHVGTLLSRIQALLSEEINRGFCFDCLNSESQCDHCLSDVPVIANRFLSKLPQIKELLNLDVVAAFQGDPAARSHGEVIFCYPVIKAMIHHRIAHALVELGVPLIPRIISEMAHAETGIDIHPGATIGSHFTIDHGTGVVIGETCIIGHHVKIYQGVTLGAKSFPLDEMGNPIKGIARHPIVGNNVVIYANATILGRISIGDNATIGGNTWVTRDVPANSKITF